MGSTSWKTTPTNGNFDEGENWEGGRVPDDVATFGASSIQQIVMGASAWSVKELSFTEAGSAYSLVFGPSAATPGLAIGGTGVSNTSGSIVQITIAANPDPQEAPQLQFSNTACAGDASVHYSVGPTSLLSGYAGGILTFSGHASAGSATFDIRTGAVQPPPGPVGAEVRFQDQASASHGSFTVYGTLGTDGDTFGNAVFHGSSTADHASFLNIGGTVTGGDGGNTQFYEQSTAANGTYVNKGGTVAEANGGDVAFDGVATAGNGSFDNHAAPAAGAYGGVTSFNNNPPVVASGGASAGAARIRNHGAMGAQQGGGGHTEFTAKYGSPTGGEATIDNFGSERSSRSCAGHTYLSINTGASYAPDGGRATFNNHPAPTATGVAGYTELAVWSNDDEACTPTAVKPSAGDATFNNVGATVAGAQGGFTVFSGGSTAARANLNALSGANGGDGGKILFYDDAEGGTATVGLQSGATLGVSGHSGPLSLGSLQVDGGRVEVQVGNSTTSLSVNTLTLTEAGLGFLFETGEGFELGEMYPLMSCPTLSSVPIERFSGRIEGLATAFSIVDDTLYVQFLLDPPR